MKKQDSKTEKTLNIEFVTHNTFIAEDENGKMILIVAEDEGLAELKLSKQGIESYMLRYMIMPDKIIQ